VPSVNFTVRSFLVGKPLSVAARSNALDGVAINPVIAGSDKPANLESLLNSRRVNSCLLVSLITSSSRSFNAAPIDTSRFFGFHVVEQANPSKAQDTRGLRAAKHPRPGNASEIAD
jgi:hypothetical protein